jgi:dihydroorotate dehydrogenase (fumarate)
MIDYQNMKGTVAMDLSTTYMGLKLKNPLVAAASPLSYELGNIKKLEDAGAAAVVLFSLFEEQIEQEQRELFYYMSQGTESFAEALTYFPEPDHFNAGPEEYLELIRKAKESTNIPIIASLNGVSRGGWIDYARKMEEAGADAIELNVYLLPTNLDVSGSEIESVYTNILAAVKAGVKIPVATKLSPFFSSIPNMARKLDRMEADALVLFNRFYQPDINLEKLEVEPSVTLSRPGTMLVSLRWIAILFGRIKASLAASGGVHTAQDVIKSVMAGADITQMAAALLQHGPEHLGKVLKEMEAWMTEHEYKSLEEMKGSMSHKSVAEPAAFERANYMKALSGYSRR